MKSIGSLLGAALLLSACASTPPSPDVTLSSRVKQEIAQTEGIGGASSVHVQSHNGVVLLSGFIGSEQQKADAGQAALKVSGVEKVFNDIKVKNQSSSGR